MESKCRGREVARPAVARGIIVLICLTLAGCGKPSALSVQKKVVSTIEATAAVSSLKLSGQEQDLPTEDQSVPAAVISITGSVSQSERRSTIIESIGQNIAGQSSQRSSLRI
jgi:hypothetical protein